MLITVPLLVGSLRGTTTMAMVADARGFGASKRRGSLRVHRRTAADVWGYAVLVMLVMTALVLNHFHIGARPLLAMRPGNVPRSTGQPSGHRPASSASLSRHEETRCVTTQSCSTTAAR